MNIRTKLALVEGEGPSKAMAQGKGAASARDELVALLERVAKDDRKALAMVYAKTSAKLFGVCIRITRDHAAAEDILQHVYIKIWNSAERFDHRQGSPITWLCAIARNASIDWLRKYGAPAPALSVMTESLTQDFHGAMDALADYESRALIFDCLQALPSQQQHAIRLAFFDGFSHSDLARSMKVPLGTTKSWIRRGLVQLRGCLQNG